MKPWASIRVLVGGDGSLRRLGCRSNATSGGAPKQPRYRAVALASLELGQPFRAPHTSSVPVLPSFLLRSFLHSTAVRTPDMVSFFNVVALVLLTGDHWRFVCVDDGSMAGGAHRLPCTGNRRLVFGLFRRWGQRLGDTLCSRAAHQCQLHLQRTGSASAWQLHLHLSRA